MSYENNGGFETLVDKFKERNNLFGVPAVKIPSRFIGQNNSGAADQTPGDSDALLFASGKLIGKSFLLIGDAERLDDFLKIISSGTRRSKSKGRHMFLRTLMFGI